MITEFLTDPIIYEIDTYTLLGGILGSVLIGAIVGYWRGWTRHRNSEAREALTLLEKMTKSYSDRSNDTGIALLKKLDEKKVQDNAKVEIGVIRQWIIAEAREK